MSEKTICSERRVKVEREPDQVIQTYNIEYRDVEQTRNRISKIVYKQNIEGNERLEITFSELAPGTITKYGNSLFIEPDSTYSWRLKQRLEDIHPKIMETILNQLSPEAKSFLEKALEHKMAAEIEIIDKAKIKEKQKRDIATYHNMLEEIVSELNKNGFSVSCTKEISGNNSHLIQVSEPKHVAKISPISLEEDSVLECINIEIDHENERALSYIEKAVRMYSYEYTHLKKIAIIKALEHKNA